MVEDIEQEEILEDNEPVEAENVADEENIDTNQLTDEELDSIADSAIEVLRNILEYFESDGAEINEYEGDEGELLLDVVGGDLAVLIGRRGHTLDSLQTLVSSIVHRKIGFRFPITIDVESYKHRQRQKLENMALSAASRADRQGREVKLRPMTPYERRIIHMALREDDRVKTHSEGNDPERCVVVVPA